MPLNGIGGYPPTMLEFSANWNDLDAYIVAEGGTALTLRNLYTVSDLDDDRVTLLDAINAVITADNGVQTTAAALKGRRAALVSRAVQFRRWVLGYLPGSPYERAMPAAPKIGAAESKFLAPLQDISGLWSRINADATVTGVPKPVALTGGYLLAAFSADLTAARAAFVTAKEAEEEARLRRKMRDALLKPAERRLVEYRSVVLARYEGTPYAANIPALWPPPGSTPEPVALTGAWNPTLGKAVLSWTASDNPNLDRYNLRACTGTAYRTANEFSVGDFPPGTLSAQTATALPLPGSDAVYRLYVVLDTGNERGSNNAAVSRPF